MLQKFELIETRIIKNLKEYVGIYIKTEKAQEQEWDGAL